MLVLLQQRRPVTDHASICICCGEFICEAMLAVTCTKLFVLTSIRAPTPTDRFGNVALDGLLSGIKAVFLLGTAELVVAAAEVLLNTAAVVLVDPIGMVLGVTRVMQGVTAGSRHEAAQQLPAHQQLLQPLKLASLASDCTDAANAAKHAIARAVIQALNSAVNSAVVVAGAAGSKAVFCFCICSCIQCGCKCMQLMEVAGFDAA